MREKQTSVNLTATLGSYFGGWQTAFDRFWFTPRASSVLCLIRLLTGLISFYSIATWSLELDAFFGVDGMLPSEYRTSLGLTGSWSYLDFANSNTSLWILHLTSLVVVGMFTIGLLTGITSWMAALVMISYANRSIGAGFGLDQICVFLCLYCAIGHAGDAFSIDSWWRSSAKVPVARTRTNIALRLIQIHMCVVYLFAAIGKLQGETWWTGEAVWLALASYEYQTLQMTWLCNWMPLVAAMTLVSLFWELAYPALIWPRLTRPIMLALAVAVHLGIGFCMGMMPFGLIMLIGNMAFLEPEPHQTAQP